MARDKPHLNLIVVGHVDNGKSTLVARLMVSLNLVDQKELEEVKNLAKEYGKETDYLAYLLDKSIEERKRGLTIDIAAKKIPTKKYIITILDAPGHRDFIKNMITGSAQSDAAIVAISAVNGEAETALGPDGQGREHLLLLRTLGIPQVIIAITKIDTVNYDQKRYEQIKNMVLQLAKQIGYQEKQIKAIVPVAAYNADENVTQKSPKLSWYNGPTLLEALDQLDEPPRLIDKPLRLPISEVYNIKGVGLVPAGKVESGKLKPGDKVVFLPSKKPSGVTGEVKSVEMHHEKLDEALPGDNIGFNVKGPEAADIGRGDVVGKIGEALPKLAEEFTARVFILQHPSAIAVGYTPVVHIHTAAVSCKVAEIQSRLDPKTGQEAEKNPQYIKTGDAAIIKFVPTKPLVVEKFQEYPGTSLGRFALRDMNKTVGVGQVLDVKERKIELK
ncbi:elongation factor 1-alpha [Nanobdella aerobiophila]|uniref:Elongation factor 1-alpha n=1 Tax=Nanobdella aerobiophila TaxID=2586965 RepID=A0A915SZE6_9ARCH|nr:translation elongation factor EF-1 subunit alpha [Nanobdella aerobiophila]BBL45199.1 elongation factor 1-alpha [Nanobdella aerobiophila]